ncbi:phage recombination protein Bet [Rhodoferax ferrireducens]|uniref:phage recombination protein Bet n=1 Tax=Rhodoferax ferrireducens TaxID=192843 RepID=UPI000E0CEFFE|nr:phage recombination protein Bet [Rhodoferax ferrireducens]
MNAATNHEIAVMQDDELIDVLCSSLYPGAKRTSAALVLSYCRAASLDPMLKPVHIVPMRCKTGEKDNYGNDKSEMRDTIMPGIGLYRIQAARTGQYAGQEAPVFGPMIVMNYQRLKTEWVSVPGRDKKVKKEEWVDEGLEYPEWCSITVYRIVQGVRCAWTAVEYWIENYATAGRDSDVPNEMWARRTRGQLAKCAEAQALRKGFSEVGSIPTAEEMEGRAFEFETYTAPEPAAEPAKPKRASEAAQAALPEPEAPVVLQPVIPAEKVEELPVKPAQAAAQKQAAMPVNTPTGEPASAGECMNVIKTCSAKKIDLAGLLEGMQLDLDPLTLTGMSKATFKEIKARL